MAKFTFDVLNGVIRPHEKTERFWVRCPFTQSFGKGQTLSEADENARKAAHKTATQWTRFKRVVLVIPDEMISTWIDDTGAVNWETADKNAHEIEPLKFWIGPK